MNNIITKGSEILSLPISSRQSTVEIVINEDYCILVQIISCAGGVVTGKKVWDTNTPPKTYYALAKYEGQTGVPTSTDLQTNSYTVFYRCGDFASQGTAGFELHTEDATKCSWVCFVGKQS